MSKTDSSLPEKLSESGVYVRGLSKSYRSGGKLVHACDGIDFHASAGSITTLLGPNGAGKSSLLKCIAGILLPSSGEICVHGEQEQSKIRASVGYVGEQPLLDGSLTVAESLFFEAELRSKHKRGDTDAKSRSRLLKRAVRMTAIESVLDKKCASLSKGYAQRVSLAQAICSDPELLLLDEFSGGLDPAQIVGIRTGLKELAKEKTVIVSTHNIAEALELGGQIVIMKEGRLVATGKADEIIQNTGKENLEAAFLSLTT